MVPLVLPWTNVLGYAQIKWKRGATTRNILSKICEMNHWVVSQEKQTKCANWYSKTITVKNMMSDCM